MRKKSFFTPVLWVPLLACSSNDTHHTITTPDASGSGSGSGSAAPCTASATYGSAFLSEFAETTGSGSDATMMGSHIDYFDGDLNADALPDTLELQFWYGVTEFKTMDIAPGTFAIGPDDADLNTCGLCAIIFTDQGSDNKPTDLYVADSGVVTLTQATGSNFVGSVSNLNFAHIDFDGSGNQFTVDTCNSKIAAASFNTQLMGNGSGSGSGSGSATVTGQPRFGGHIHFASKLPTLRNRHR
jgi:hypothetical protein